MLGTVWMLERPFKKRKDHMPVILTWGRGVEWGLEADWEANFTL